MPGGKRNHDLLLECRDDAGPFIVGVEAKADETYGQTLAGYRAAAQRRLDAGERTNGPARLENLTRNLADSTIDDDPTLGGLRYQLFSALAGTIAACPKGSDRAVLLVVEFATAQTDARRRGANRSDLAAFAKRVLDLEPPSHDTWLLDGPRRSIGSCSARVWLGHMTVEP